MDNLVIRFARPEDRQPVFDIAATVWEGNDYIPEVWGTWMAERPSEGFVLTAELDGRVVGIQHTALQPGHVAWLEGIRVHPDFRNQGVAGLLGSEGLRISKERGCRIARLSTADVNLASQKAAHRNGFREVCRFFRFSAPSSPEKEPSVSALSADAIMLARIRAINADSSTLLADGWTAYEVPEQVPTTWFPLHLATAARDGIVLARPTPHRGRISLAYIGGSPEAIRKLGLALRRLAHEAGIPEVGGMLQRIEPLPAGLESAGYEMRDDLNMVVHERSL